MSNSITIEEQRHHVWKIGTFIAGGLTILFSILFWYQSDPLWVGILRLIAFIFFSLTVFGALKLLDGPVSITIGHTPTHFQIIYQQNEKKIREEEFERSAIQEFIFSTENKSPWKRYLKPRSATLKIRFNDGRSDLHPFEYGGRTLFFNESALLEIQDFLNAQQTQYEQPEAEQRSKRHR